MMREFTIKLWVNFLSWLPLEIAKIVEAQEIDLLVMGAHGHKGVQDLIFGTTLDSVRNKITVPILIVK